MDFKPTLKERGFTSKQFFAGISLSRQSVNHTGLLDNCRRVINCGSENEQFRDNSEPQSLRFELTYA